MNKKLLLIPLLVLALLLTACGNKNPDTPEEPDVSVTTTVGEGVEGDNTTAGGAEDGKTTTAGGAEDGKSTTAGGAEDGKTTTAGGAENGKTTKTSKTTAPSDNKVDWEDAFGSDDPTTTVDKNDPTKDNPTTTTTKKSTTTTTIPTTTIKPTVIEKVTLPAVGSDVDGKGRIKVSAIDLEDGVLKITIRNYTDEQKTQWITEETDYVAYACYDKNGKQLTGDDDTFGYLYLGCLENGEEISFSVVLPKGTDTVRLTGAKIVYWTPWS